MRTYIALVHHPVYNKTGEVITTSITGFDLHDIARSAATFGIEGYYVANPNSSQIQFAERIIGLWAKGESFDFNPTRAEAFKKVKLVSSLEDAISDIERLCGKRPKVVMTSAKAEGGIGYNELSKKILSTEDPYLIVFGTGWGLTKEVMNSADHVLAPIIGRGSYRHLSVRSAAAIILDRLFGERRS